MRGACGCFTSMAPDGSWNSMLITRVRLDPKAHFVKRYQLRRFA